MICEAVLTVENGDHTVVETATFISGISDAQGARVTIDDDRIYSNFRSGAAIAGDSAYIYGAYVYEGQPSAFYSQYDMSNFGLEATTEDPSQSWSWREISNEVAIATDSAVTFEEYSNGTIEYDSGKWEASFADGNLSLDGTLDGTNVEGTLNGDFDEGKFMGGFVGIDAIDEDGNSITAGSFAGATADEGAVLGGIWESN